VTRLANRTALVTGGSRGIGAVIVEAFAREGADVAFCHDGDAEGAAAVAAKVAATGSETLAAWTF
jgi:3-oxoacyl-[acyl-carrier protein] reductase